MGDGIPVRTGRGVVAVKPRRADGSDQEAIDLLEQVAWQIRNGYTPSLAITMKNLGGRCNPQKAELLIALVGGWIEPFDAGDGLTGDLEP